ncbi:response regulator transcription factor [Bartonella ancashensis]|uniref:DNA-binding response regulator n=1 Tax=Bartonella ancashensis TaxID=1318743 RepID=A0A0M3T2R9_9HYPH|nr:response regulator transcription factor [Bartonella ancashensis]ALE03215.1 DNA-binding response regulator [Bartonella ancashensis]
MSDYALLIIEDDDDLRPILAEQLQMHKEFKIFQAKKGKESISIVQKENIHLIIIDIASPNYNEHQTVKILRQQGFRAPIIIITDHSTNGDTLLSLEDGANDYVTKPFRFAILLARIRAQLRQYELNEDITLHIGPYNFKPGQKLLTDQQNRKIRLTEKETALLKYLYCTKNKIVSRETLLKKIWGYNEHIVTHTLETHIYRLRKKIRNGPSNTPILITDGNGYRLNI